MSIVAIAGRVDAAIAERIAKPDRFLEVVVADAFDDAAVATLAARWKNVRLIATGPRSARASGAQRLLRSVPGGGGEIFAPAVRRKIGLGKCTGEDWLTVMHVAHELGMNTSATVDVWWPLFSHKSDFHLTHHSVLLCNRDPEYSSTDTQVRVSFQHDSPRATPRNRPRRR